ncbi:unnamed protein product [Staurois parvus]|uniref:Teneurin-like YD-shell domain-containing protein n=1 Tax=Staurois parvus TaxID=386267 RepID=A0ABN9EIM6_9NEOB|nr:unnamed protein product [Staurois parvus]
MEVALQTEPHLLAGTVNPTVGKRNVTLPIDNGLNLVEWRQRKEQARGQVTVFGRRLRVHNRNLLSLDFDRVTRTEKINDDHRKFTLRILYDQAGRPSLWSPSNGLSGVNVTYSPGGHVAGIQREEPCLKGWSMTRLGELHLGHSLMENHGLIHTWKSRWCYFFTARDSTSLSLIKTTAFLPLRCPTWPDKP